MRIALASREVYPLGGGGIGQFVAAAARMLSRVAEVTVLTTSIFESEYGRLRAARDPRLSDDVRVAFVPEPTIEETAGWYHVMHCYGDRLLARLRELYPDGGPDVLEFPDFLGEGFVPLQAALARDPLFADTRIVVRVHTSGEMCDVLDGYCRPDAGTRALHAMERFALAHADNVIWQGGDILGTYQRFYGRAAIAAPVRIRYPYAGPTTDAASDVGFTVDGPLRILYAGRLERRKGVQNLVDAVTGLGRDDVSLTLVGDDTGTAPLGVSMRAKLELAVADDPRISIRGPLDRQSLAEAIRAHHVIAIPSLWECWPYAALEPLHLNRPVLGTAVGGLVEQIQPGVSGWLAQQTDAVALEEALVELLRRRAELEGLVRSGSCVAHARRLTDDSEIIGAYEQLASQRPARQRSPAASRRPPLVSAIVPYYRASRYVRDAIGSLLAQTYPRLEIVLVNDGSFDDRDWIVAEIAGQLPVIVVTQINRGLGAARNFGISQSRGRYVFPLDADNLAEPEFVARAVDVLEHDPQVAYVTSWSRYIGDVGDERPGVLGYQPLGNHAELNAEDNVAGDAAAVLRRRLFDAGFRYSEELTSFEDWHLYRELQRAGHFGAVIPERLIRYRVRDDSMQAQIAGPRRERLTGEIAALIRENAVRWTSSSA